MAYGFNNDKSKMNFAVAECSVHANATIPANGWGTVLVDLPEEYRTGYKIGVLATNFSNTSYMPAEVIVGNSNRFTDNGVKRYQLKLYHPYSYDVTISTNSKVLLAFFED